MWSLYDWRNAMEGDRRVEDCDVFQEATTLETIHRISPIMQIKKIGSLVFVFYLAHRDQRRLRPKSKGPRPNLLCLRNLRNLWMLPCRQRKYGRDIHWHILKSIQRLLHWRPDHRKLIKYRLRFVVRAFSFECQQIVRQFANIIFDLRMIPT